MVRRTKPLQRSLSTKYMWCIHLENNKKKEEKGMSPPSCMGSTGLWISYRTGRTHCATDPHRPCREGWSRPLPPLCICRLTGPFPWCSGSVKSVLEPPGGIWFLAWPCTCICMQLVNCRVRCDLSILYLPSLLLFETESRKAKRSCCSRNIHVVRLKSDIIDYQSVVIFVSDFRLMLICFVYCGGGGGIGWYAGYLVWRSYAW